MLPHTATPRRRRCAVAALAAVTVLLAALPAAPVAAAAPHIRLDDDYGRPGMVVTVRGRGFPKDRAGAVRFGTTRVARFRTSAARGRFRVKFSVPSGYRGPVPVTASTASATAESAFTVSPPSTDALQRRARAELGVFTDWLRDNRVRGYIGEVGWPNDRDTKSWNALARKWYADATAADLWVTAWATGEWWGDGYRLSTYRASNWEWTGVDTPTATAGVVERQSGRQRGINVAGAEFAFPDVATTSRWSNEVLGLYDREWHYSGAATFDYLASRGMTTVRLPFRWERIQPELGAPLDSAELGRLTRAVEQAEASGLDVILDVHNYGGYYLADGLSGVRHGIGTKPVTIARFANLWDRLSRHFAGHRGVLAYGLMNEPVDMAGGAQTWETASQAAVDAIRGNGDTTLVMVPGYAWSGVQRWPQQHPTAWIRDPADRHRYEAHQYFDRTNASTYAYGYDAEVRDAAERGY